MPASFHESGKVIAWARRVYSDGVDKKDAQIFADAFVEDGWLRFGNNEPIVGKGNIREAIAGFFTVMASLSHEEVGTTYKDGTLVLEANVTYTLHQGGTVTVPACTVFRLADPSVESEPRAAKCRIYVDLAPLFSAASSPVS